MLRQAVTTLVMHHDARRVLMGRRSSVGAFANQLVFPGGKIDAIDAADMWRDRYVGAEGLEADERIRRIAAARELCEETGIEVKDLGAMYPLSRWVTPEGMPIRFDTWFYILELPEGQDPVADGVEIMHLEWAYPDKIVASVRAGEFSLVFPTFAHLVQLYEFGEGWRDWPEYAKGFADPLRPHLVQDPDGTVTARIPAGAGFSVTEHTFRL